MHKALNVYYFFFIKISNNHLGAIDRKANEDNDKENLFANEQTNRQTVSNRDLYSLKLYMLHMDSADAAAVSRRAFVILIINSRRLSKFTRLSIFILQIG